jgi:hypothetical protein
VERRRGKYDIETTDFTDNTDLKGKSKKMRN